MEQLKHRRYLRLILPIVVVIIVFSSVLMLSADNGRAALRDADKGNSEMVTNSEIVGGLSLTGTTTGTIYLPVTMNDYPWISPFGIEVGHGKSLTPGGVFLDRAVGLKSNWVRLNSRISWRALQPNEGDPINWPALAEFESELIALKEQGMTPVVIIDDHPHWAVKPFYKNGQWVYSSCAAIRTDKFGAFRDFVRQIVDRYSAPEFGVHHWELGNEPDVDPRIVTVDKVFGCWGDFDDPFYGGEHYGEMLKVVTPAIKAVDPRAQVWVGGLLLNSPNTTNPNAGKPEKFLAGILESKAGPYFDVLPYHAYFGYNGQPVDQDNAVVTSPWHPWGGVVVGKVNYLRQVLTQYGVDKPIFLDEFALNCPEYVVSSCNPPVDDFLQMQANQLVRSITRGLANQIMGFTWYTLDGPGWRNGSLLDENQNPRLAYNAYQNLTVMLSNSKYLSPQNYGNGLEAYRFSRGSTFIDVLWAKENQELTVTFPFTDFVEARSRDGALLMPTTVNGNYQLPVDFSPIFIVFE